MATRAGSGTSTAPDTHAAAAEATRTALASLGEKPPRLGFLFASGKHNLKGALDAAHAAAPGCRFVGSHTAGEFTERGLTHGGIAVLVLGSDTLEFEAAWASGVKAGPEAVARALCAPFAALTERALSRGLRLSSTVMLVDGLAGTGERVVREVMKGTRMFQHLVGGAAGDDGAFRSTWVGAGPSASADSAAAVHVFDKLQWGVGVGHGLRPVTERMTVTRASGSTVHEIDGRPAFEAYRSFAAGRGLALVPETAGSFLIGNELGVFFLDELHHARAPVAVGPAGELRLVAEIAEGESVCILDGESDSMVEACGLAAREARESLRGAPCAAVLVFDCVCRGMILGAGFQREIEQVKEAFPDTPVAGFLTYGEIARYRGKLDGWHNTSSVVVAIPA